MTFQSPSLRGSGRFSGGGSGRRCARRSFNPLHCGAVVASLVVVDEGRFARAFQSPSLRGSGRFRHRHHVSPKAVRRFNPLHCGAVVASIRRATRSEGSWKVSIPFIAGQWSLHQRGPDGLPIRVLVSIPFIAGQWSLLTMLDVFFRSAGVFQSPSLRGSGRFTRRPSSKRCKPPRFNPLHCGAVVASTRALDPVRCRRLVSIPFIAGQWSLPGPVAGQRSPAPCFNPLHCGAVVASRPARRTAGGQGASFNPLHCGAVVAS